MKRALIALAAAALLATQAFAAELNLYSGAPLPDFTLSDLHGKHHTLSSLKGRVVVVNFWATYCPPCIKEMPSLQRLKEKMQGKPFTLLAVNMAEEQGAIESFLQRFNHKIDFPILLDPQAEVVEGWMISAVPTTFILDTKGNIRYALYGGLEWDSPEVINTINALLKK